MSERLRLTLPTKELQNKTLSFMKAIGLEFTFPDRCLFVPINNMPIDFAFARASSIPSLTSNGRTEVKAGITGSDILWEIGMGKINAGEELPLKALVPNSKQSRLYIGINKDFANRIRLSQMREPTTQDFSGFQVATGYPRITQEVFLEKNIKNNSIEIIKESGALEGMSNFYPRCVGIVDNITSGKTADANEIEVLETFHMITLQMIVEIGKLSRKDMEI